MLIELPVCVIQPLRFLTTPFFFPSPHSASPGNPCEPPIPLHNYCSGFLFGVKESLPVCRLTSQERRGSDPPQRAKFF